MKHEHRFPDLELSYETYAHKKVLTNYDICLAIPTGKKVFAWFTYDEETGKDAVYFVELNKHFKVCKIDKTSFACHHSLAYQTILYGTLTELIGQEHSVPLVSQEHSVPLEPIVTSYYIVEDVYYYQGLYVKNLSFGEKLHYLHSMFANELVPNTFALPYMCLVQLTNMMLDSLSFYESICSQSAYTTHHIQFRSSSEVVPYLNHTYKKKQEQVVVSNSSDLLLFPHKDLDHDAQNGLRNAIFKVKADIQADVYHLYAYDTKTNDYVYVNIAYIGSLDSSKYMNSLFRKIRENENIDYGEESEDEDDFQNVNLDKYVDLSKTYFMNCVYNTKFKKWIPVNVVQDFNKCVPIHQLVYNTSKDYNISKGYNTSKNYNTSKGYNTSKNYNASKGYNANKNYNANKIYNTSKNYNASKNDNVSKNTYKPYNSANKPYNTYKRGYSKYGSSVSSSTYTAI